MVLDPRSQQIFVLGKYVEGSARATESLKSEFYAYHIPTNSWQLISEDLSLHGGPKYIVIDEWLKSDVFPTLCIPQVAV